MKNIILKSAFLGVVLSGSAIKAQHLLEALDAPAIFTSTKTAEYTASFNKSSCTADNFTNFPKPVSYTQSATVTATSTESQAEADKLAIEKATQEAKNKVNVGGQAYADANGTCLNYNDLSGKCMVTMPVGSRYERGESIETPSFPQCHGYLTDVSHVVDSRYNPEVHTVYGDRLKVETRFYPDDKTLPSYGWFYFIEKRSDGYYNKYFTNIELHNGVFEPQQ